MEEHRDTRQSLIEGWLAEIKTGPHASGIGMLLVHNGIVRGHSRTGEPVSAMILHVDLERLGRALESTRAKEGILEVRAWINEGNLAVGDDMMYVLVAGDIRPHVIPALEDLVAEIKSEVVIEEELPPQ